MADDIASQIAPSGTLRVGLNMANALLITGRTPDGEPDGVAPDMGREIAKTLGVGVALIQYPAPGAVADACAEGAWDIAMIGADPSRAETIDFTAAYVEIESTYLVPDGSPFRSVGDVDNDGVRVAVSERSAYDLYLTRSLKHAALCRAKGLPGAMELFLKDGLDAVAGLRPVLLDEQERRPGFRILDGSFTTIQQAIGVAKGKNAGAQFLRDFVEEAKSSGLVARLIERHGVVGRLSVAPPA
jgi:polar amino acid transport system substrate-binding protein